jgi:hypothetical protein
MSHRPAIAANLVVTLAVDTECQPVSILVTSATFPTPIETGEVAVGLSAWRPRRAVGGIFLVTHAFAPAFARLSM